MKKNIKKSKEEIKKIEEHINIGNPKYSDTSVEKQVDFGVKELLKKFYDDKCIKLDKTGIREIDKKIPPYHSENSTDKKNGKLDVMIFNFFNDNKIDVIIEDKVANSNENAILQAETYAGVGNFIGKPVRIIIGNTPSKDLIVRILVDKEYLPLKINGKEVKSFFGEEILKMIYENPNINEFILEEKKEKVITQKEFHNIINNLKTLYRQIPEIQNNDDISINFTIAFIGLKMVMEKSKKELNEKEWDSIKDSKDILDILEKIIGDTADKKIKKKYQDIFKIVDKDDKVKFDFYKQLKDIRARENTENNESIKEEIDKNSNKKKNESTLMKIHKAIEEINSTNDLPIDLFGEVYECLASKKTKSMLGEFFTRRHIIKAIVRMFFSSKDIKDIIKYKKIIVDPACGTGGFLTESFKYIKNYCEKEKKLSKKEISELANKIIVGYDINANSIGRTRINMILAGDGFSDIDRYNTLQANWYNQKENSGIKKDVDYVLTNVPYGQGDYAVSNKESDEFIKNNKNKRLELNFVLKIIEMLKEGGRASIILPEGLLEAPTLSNFRDYLLRQCKIETIISLPKFAFAPYTKWKTYVIFLEKREKILETIEKVINKNEKIWCYIVDNDGYANSNKRFPTALKGDNGEWLHNELERYIDCNQQEQLSKIEVAFENKLEDEKEIYLNEWNEEIKGKKYGFISINDIVQKKYINYKALSIKEINARLKNEANNKNKLSNENYKFLISRMIKNDSGYSIKEENYIEKGKIKKDFFSIFEELEIMYDEENKKFYDLNNEEFVYALPLIPEKYFRRKEIKEITLEELEEQIFKIENNLKELLGSDKNED